MLAWCGYMNYNSWVAFSSFRPLIIVLPGPGSSEQSLHKTSRKQRSEKQGVQTSQGLSQMGTQRHQKRQQGSNVWWPQGARARQMVRWQRVSSRGIREGQTGKDAQPTNSSTGRSLAPRQPLVEHLLPFAFLLPELRGSQNQREPS